MATPAVARVWIAEVPIFFSLTSRNMVAKPSMRFSNSGSTASGVTSRPVKPVPPVVMMTSMNLSAIQAFTRCADRLDVVLDDRALGEHVAGGADALGQRGAGFVVGKLARVGHGEHRDLQRHELSGLVDAGHLHAVLKLRPPLNVSQADTLPSLKPVVNQRWRCAEEPWVKASGTT